jgi:hypothetical protein
LFYGVDRLRRYFPNLSSTVAIERGVG